MKVQWLPRARHNLQSHLDYIAERNPAAATETSRAISAAVHRLRDFPESGRPGRILGTRELVVNRTPFVIVYRLVPAGVMIVRVLHAAKRWP